MMHGHRNIKYRPLFTEHLIILLGYSIIRHDDINITQRSTLKWQLVVYADRHQQHRHCMYNVTLKRVHATTVAVQNQWVLQNLCVFVALGIQHAICMRHIIMWPASQYKIFPHYLIKGTIFEKKLLNIKCVFQVSLQLVSQKVSILRITERDMIENVYWYSCQVPFIIFLF